MCNLSDLVEERGIEKGRLDTLISLVQDGLLGLAEAAKRAEMTSDEFRSYIKL